MTAVLREDPPPLPETVPSGVDRIIRHALERDPNDRFQSARDCAFALQALNEPPTASGEQAIPGRGAAPIRPIRAREAAAWILAGVMGVSAAAILWLTEDPFSDPGSPGAGADAR